MVRSEQFSTSVIGCVLSAEAMTCNKNANILPGQSKVDMAEQVILSHASAESDSVIKP